MSSFHQRAELTDWLSPTDTYQDFVRESSRPLRPGGAWFLSHEEFRTWMRFPQRVLWTYGFPGSGKTVLSTSIISHIQKHMRDNDSIGYFYCDRNEERKASPLTMISSLLSQAVNQRDEIPPAVLAAFETAKKLGRSKISNADSPVLLLKDALSTCQRVYIVVDGVDESSEASKMIDTLLDLSQSGGDISTMVFSRDIPSIRSKLSKYPGIELTASNTKVEIDSYILEAVEDSQIRLLGSKLADEIVKRLCEASDGMFLWAYLMIQHIKAAISPFEITEILERLPEGLCSTYALVLKNLCKESPSRRKLAFKTICWVCCSVRPLTWVELQCALATDFEDMDLNPSKKPFRHVVLELCCPLIRYESKSDTLRPVHASICEYILSKPPDDLTDPGLNQFFVTEANCHRRLGLSCLAYLSSAYSSNGIDSAEPSFPLTRYACLSWPHHILHSMNESTLRQTLVEFLSSPCRQIWIKDYLFEQQATFPLQKLFYYNRCLLKWVDLSVVSERPAYLDWIFDIPSILLCMDNYRSSERTSANNISSALRSRLTISYFERLMVIRDLAREYTHTGRLRDGVRWFEVTLAMQRERYGNESIETVWLLNTLGILYDQEQLPSLSLDTQKQALTIQAAALGPDHIETIWTKNELGRVYRHLGRLQDAEKMHLEALQILPESLVGTNGSSEIAWTLSTLGRVYRKGRRLEEAIQALTQALDMRHDDLGHDHPHCLWLLGDIAQCYFEQSNLELAAKFHRQALEARERVLGPEHPDTLWTTNSLGIVLAATGKESEALELQQRALQGQERVLGAQHPHTLWTVKVLEGLHKNA